MYRSDYQHFFNLVNLCFKVFKLALQSGHTIFSGSCSESKKISDLEKLHFQLISITLKTFQVHLPEGERLDYRVHKIEETMCSHEPFLAHLLKLDSFGSDMVSLEREKQLRYKYGEIKRIYHVDEVRIGKTRGVNLLVWTEPWRGPDVRFIPRVFPIPTSST